VLPCARCGKTIPKVAGAQRDRYEAGRPVYCSKVCRRASTWRTITCAQCGAGFSTKQKGKKFCSAACQHEAVSTKVPVVCPICSTVSYRQRSAVEKHNSRFCSIACRAAGNPGRPPSRPAERFTCETCGGGFVASGQKARTGSGGPRRFCSPGCYHRSGKMGQKVSR
jgi:ribosomal protein S27E